MTAHGAARGRAVVEALAPSLAGQRRLLEHLLSFSEQDPDVAWLAIGCSVARGTADALSDLDVAMGIRDDAAAERLKAALAGFGDLVASFEHAFPGALRAHRRLFAQFADRTQVDLIFGGVGPAGLPGCIVLYDADDAVRTDDDLRRPPTREDIASWAALGFVALADLGKYVRRGSAYEAHDRLETARDYLWRLWAVCEAIPEPEYGLTSVLDAAAGFPPGVEVTVAGLELDALATAGRRLVELLRTCVDRLGGEVAEEVAALGRFVAADLDELTGQPPADQLTT